MPYSQCIYLYINDECINCRNNCYNNSYYCKIHKNNYIKKKAFKYIKNEMIQFNKKLDAYNILSIYTSMYEKNIKDVDIKNTCLLLLGKRQRAFNIADELCIYLSTKSLKKNITKNILLKFDWYCKVFKLSHINRKITMLQKIWRNNKLIKENEPLLECVNTEDPFTSDNLIDVVNIFYISEDKYRYGFEAADLDYFIKTIGAWNPYTRKIIDNIDIMRLRNYINKNKIKTKLKIEWQTIKQAYTDVIIYFERQGFLTNLDWYNKLTYPQILTILTEFANNISLFANINIDDISNTDNYVFKFCKIILNILQNVSDNSFMIINCLYSSFMNVSDDFLNNAPIWLQESSYNTIIIEYYSITIE